MPSLLTFLAEAFRAAMRRPWAAAGAALGNLFFILAGAVVPLLVGEVIALAVPDGSRQRLWEVVAAWGLITVLWLGAEWLLAWAAGEILADYSHRARTMTVRAIYDDPHSQQDAGGLATRMTSDVDAIETALMEVVIGSITDFGRLIVVGTCLAIIQPLLGLAFLVFLVLFIVFQKVAAKPVDRANDERQSAVDAMSGKLAETVRTVPVIHAYDLQEWDGERFDEVSRELRRATRRRTLIGWWPYWIGAATGQVGLLVVLTIAAVTAQTGAASVAEVAASMMYVQGAVAALLMLAAALPLLQRAGISVLRVREAAESASAAVAPRTDSAPGVSGAVEVRFTDVAIELAGGRVLLQPTTLTLPAGRWTTVVGGSGAGKSTLLGLITGQRRPTSGEVIVAGLDVDTAHVAVRTSLVLQDSLLFTTTVAENIRAGDRDADDTEVVAAAQLAELDEAIAALPEGYATLIDTTGHIISGGQRQRLAVARALVRRPQLLLLDEATSALDPQTAIAVWRTIRRVAREHDITVVAVCHQLELATDSDLLVVMQAGSVVEMGTPQELDRSAGEWRELVDAHRRVAENDVESVVRLLEAHPEVIPPDPSIIASLARSSRVYDAVAGEVVCQRGEPLEALVIVSSGRLEVFDGSSRYVLGSGSALGSLSDLVTGTVAVDATMVSGGQLVLVPRVALIPSLLDLLASDTRTAAALAWLARSERAPREELAARMGPDGAALVDGLVRDGALRILEDGQVGVIIGRRRTMSASVLDEFIDG